MPIRPIAYITFAQRDEAPAWAGKFMQHCLRFEEAGGLPCLTVPYWDVSPELMAGLAPAAVILSGFARSFQDYDRADFLPVADYIEHAVNTPMLALCGSHQLLGFLYNGTLRASERLFDEPMRRRRPGEPITNPDYHPDFIMERGFYELTLLDDDPLFTGCGRPPVVLESHYCEIKTIPPGFRLLASTPDCRVQAMRHESRPLVGVQFHPEDYTDSFPDGRRILQNFLREVSADR